MKTPLASSFGPLAQSCTFSVALLLACASFTNAADIFWTDGTASYNTPANWTGGVVPGTADNAINTNGAGNVVLINNGDPDWTLVDVQAGSAAGTAGAFLQSGQTVSSTGWTRLALGTNSVGLYTLNAGTLNVLGGRISMAESDGAVATLNINGGTINKTGDAFDIADGGFG